MNATAASDHRIPQPVANVLLEPAAYADGRIYPTYQWLRANESLGRAEVEGYDPFWVVTRHADILEISRQNELFLSGERSPILISQAAERKTREQMGGSPHLTRSLIRMDTPEHHKYRALTQGWFMPQSLRRLEDQIRVIAKGAVAKMAAAGGRCDFVSEVALHYPLRVIMSIMGVPESDEPRMLKLTQELFAPTDPELARDPNSPVEESRLEVIKDFSTYFRALSEIKRARPVNDLASVIANSQIDGQPIGDLEAMSYYIIIATAGHDTTSSSTAGAIWALAENPAELAKVKADPSLIPGLIDESIRWTSPVKNFMRTAAEDVTFADRNLKKGDWLMLCYASGNRDETVFDDPNGFHVDRRPNKHLAFGYGAHLCLGQHLAKMEMRILWEELLPRLSDLALDGAPAMSETTFVSGPKRLPISFKMS